MDARTRTDEQIRADYREFRGRCKELCEAAIVADPTLKLVRGHYCCFLWPKQPHWWCVRPDGTIVDPSVRQFPTLSGAYVEFDGMVECAECGKRVPEEEANSEGNYAFCSGLCYSHFVGIY